MIEPYKEPKTMTSFDIGEAFAIKEIVSQILEDTEKFPDNITLGDLRKMVDQEETITAVTGVSEEIADEYALLHAENEWFMKNGPFMSPLDEAIFASIIKDGGASFL